jgi:hypothetical protein
MNCQLTFHKKNVALLLKGLPASVTNAASAIVFQLSMAITYKSKTHQRMRQNGRVFFLAITRPMASISKGHVIIYVGSHILPWLALVMGELEAIKQVELWSLINNLPG